MKYRVYFIIAFLTFQSPPSSFLLVCYTNRKAGREARPLQAAKDGDGAMFRKVILECENRPHSFAKMVQKDAVRLL